MVMSPPKPAAPFNYRRFGEVKLPDELQPIIDKVCAATLAIDTKEGTLDIGIPGLTVPVKVTYSGNAFVTETGRAAVLVEGIKNGVQLGAGRRVPLSGRSVGEADDRHACDRESGAGHACRGVWRGACAGEGDVDLRASLIAERVHAALTLGRAIFAWCDGPSPSLFASVASKKAPENRGL